MDPSSIPHRLLPHRHRLTIDSGFATISIQLTVALPVHASESESDSVKMKTFSAGRAVGKHPSLHV